MAAVGCTENHDSQVLIILYLFRNLGCECDLSVNSISGAFTGYSLVSLRQVLRSCPLTFAFDHICQRLDNGVER